MIVPNMLGKIKNVPNHQPNGVYLGFIWSYIEFQLNVMVPDVLGVARIHLPCSQFSA